MKNKFLLMIVAVAVLFTTACVKTEVSDEVKELRKEQLKQAQAKTAKDLVAVANEELKLQIAKEGHEVTAQTNLANIEKQKLELAKTKANLEKAEAEGKLALAKAEADLAKQGNALAEEYAAKYNAAMFGTSPKGVTVLKDELLKYQGELLDIETKIATLKEGGDLGMIKDANVITAETNLKTEETKLEGLQKKLEELKAISQDKEQAIAAYKKAKADSAAAVYAYNEAKNKVDLIKNEKKVLDAKKHFADSVIKEQEKRDSLVNDETNGYVKKIEDKKEAEKEAQAKLDEAALDTAAYGKKYLEAKAQLATSEKEFKAAERASSVQEAVTKGKAAKMTAAGFNTPTTNGFYPVDSVLYTPDDKKRADFEELWKAYKTEKEKYDDLLKETGKKQKVRDGDQEYYNVLKPKYEAALTNVETETTNVANAHKEVEKLEKKKAAVEADIAMYKELYDGYKANEATLQEEINKKTLEVTSQEGEVKVLEAKKKNAADLADTLREAIGSTSLVGEITDTEKEIEDQEGVVEAKKVALLAAKKAADNGSLSADDVVKQLEAKKAAKEKKIADQENAVEAQQKIADAWYQKLTEALS